MGFNPIKSIINPISDVLDYGQGMWDSFSGKEQQESANKTNIELAREAMAFSERMSSTAHAREVDDLRKSGLNPILSAGGSGASSPSGVAPTVQPLPSNSAKLVSTALDVLGNINTMRAVNSNIATQGVQQGQGIANTLKTLAEADQVKSGWIGRVFGSEVGKNALEFAKKGFRAATNNANTMLEKGVKSGLVGGLINLPQKAKQNQQSTAEKKKFKTQVPSFFNE